MTHTAVQVGASPPRVDGVAKVTGAALYVDDLRPDAWWGRTVRSTCPRGRLRALVLDPGFDWSRVTVVTAADIPGKNVVTLIHEDQPALVPVGGEIRHPDEAVALIAAPTRELAEEARARVRLEVEPLPAVLSLDDALSARVLLHGPDNVFKRYEILHGDPAAGLAAADLVIEGTYATGAQEQMYIEPQGMLAEWSPDGSCHVTGSLQCPYYVHKALKPLLALPAEKVVVTQAVTGGGFGGKEEYPSMIAAHAALLARKAGRAVKLVYERDEDVAATTKRHPSRVHHRLGLMRDGTFVAADVEVLLDGGAYATLSEVVLSRAVLHAAGPYRIPAVRVRGRVLATNHPPHGAFRGFGAPQATFAYERQVAKAARALGKDPFALRRQNMFRPGDVTATGQVLQGSVGSAEVLDAVEAALRRPAPHPRAARPGWRPARGVAFCFHGSGFTGSGEERLKGQAAVAVAQDGLFEVRAASTDIGQGALTIFTQIAADALEVDPACVRVLPASTDRVPDSGPTVASRTCMVVGGVVEQAAETLAGRLRAWGREAGLPTGDLAALARQRAERAGELSVVHTYAPPAGIRWDDKTYSGDAYGAYGWACCAVELAVDPDTFEVELLRCVHAVDVGKAVHPRIVQGQIEGGTLQALGWALWESVVYREGRVQNQRMTNCIIPTAIEAPEMETILVEVPYAHGPWGAKGVGEIPMDEPAAAVADALEGALGVPMDVLPLLPETIERLVREGGRA